MKHVTRERVEEFLSVYWTDDNGARRPFQVGGEDAFRIARTLLAVMDERDRLRARVEELGCAHWLRAAEKDRLLIALARLVGRDEALRIQRGDSARCGGARSPGG